MLDTSVRLHRGLDELLPMYEKAVETDGFVLFTPTEHSVFAATNPGTFDYFNVDPKRLQKVECLESVSLLYNTESAFWRFLYWLYLCSLDPDCISPPGSTVWCQFKPDRFTFYAKCHRYDQSILNIIAASYYNYTMDSYQYANVHEHLLGIRRHSTQGAENVTSCK